MIIIIWVVAFEQCISFVVFCLFFCSQANLKNKRNFIFQRVESVINNDRSLKLPGFLQIEPADRRGWNVIVRIRRFKLNFVVLFFIKIGCLYIKIVVPHFSCYCILRFHEMEVCKRWKRGIFFILIICHCACLR